MTRTRTPLPDTRFHSGEMDFLLSPRTAGPHSVNMGGQWLDLLYVDRGASATMIGFHSSLTVSGKLPMFSGGALAAESGMNYIGVSDPSIPMGVVPLAWYLGNQEIGPLRPRLVPLLHHLLGSSHPVLFGASGGGYAAVLYAQDFPGCTVVAANPRLNMLNKPAPTMLRYAQVCHGAEGRTAIKRVRSTFVVEDLADLYPGGLPFDLILLQNQQDEAFLEGQAQPFLERFGSDARLTYVQLHNGAGHVPVPRRILLETLVRAASKATAH